MIRRKRKKPNLEKTSCVPPFRSPDRSSCRDRFLLKRYKRSLLATKERKKEKGKRRARRYWKRRLMVVIALVMMLMTIMTRGRPLCKLSHGHSVFNWWTGGLAMGDPSIFRSEYGRESLEFCEILDFSKGVIICYRYFGMLSH